MADDRTRPDDERIERNSEEAGRVNEDMTGSAGDEFEDVDELDEEEDQLSDGTE